MWHHLLWAARKEPLRPDDFDAVHWFASEGSLTVPQSNDRETCTLVAPHANAQYFFIELKVKGREKAAAEQVNGENGHSFPALGPVGKAKETVCCCV